MFEAVLQRLNVPTLARNSRNTWIEESISREAIDLKALNNRLKISPLYGEFNPPDHLFSVDAENVCVKITSVFVSDGALMGLIEPFGPKGHFLQQIIDARLPVTLTMRARKEYSKTPVPDRPGFEDIRVQRVADIIAFDLYTVRSAGQVTEG